MTKTIPSVVVQRERGPDVEFQIQLLYRISRATLKIKLRMQQRACREASRTQEDKVGKTPGAGVVIALLQSPLQSARHMKTIQDAPISDRHTLTQDVS